MSQTAPKARCHDDGSCAVAARARGEVARAAQRVSANVTTALANVDVAACGRDERVTCSDALRGIEEAVRQSEALTQSLRSLWSELSGCAPGCEGEVSR